MNLVNLTPHTINVYLPNGQIVEFPSVGVARVNTIEKVVGQITVFDVCDYPVEVKQTSYTDVVGLPEHPTPDTCYIVSMVVAQHLSGKRPDLICPDTFKGAVRDDKGQIIGTRNFVVY